MAEPPAGADPKTKITSEALREYIGLVMAIRDTIHDLGKVPEGQLYAVLAPKLTLPGFNRIIDTLIEAGVVKRDSIRHVLVWCGEK